MKKRFFLLGDCWTFLAFDGLFFVYNFIFCEKGSAFWKAEIRGEGKHSELRRPFPLPTPLPSGHAVVLRCGDVIL